MNDLFNDEGDLVNHRAIARHYATSDVDTALTWLVSQDGESTELPPGMDEYDRMDLGKVLQHEGLIREDRSAAGEWTLSSTGKKVAAELIDGRKENGWLRRNLVVRGLLTWIDGNSPRFADEFTGQLVENQPVTENECSKIVDYLVKSGLIEGHTVGDHVMTPTLTALGTRVKDDDRLPDDVLNYGGSVTNDQSNNLNIHNSTVGVASAGNNTSQSGVTVSVETRTEIMSQIEKIRQDFVELDDAPAQSAEALDRLEQAASDPASQPSKLKELYGAFMGSIGAKLGDVTWAGVAHGAIALGALLA